MILHNVKVGYATSNINENNRVLENINGIFLLILKIR